jgi:hypothetical protein
MAHNSKPLEIIHQMGICANMPCKRERLAIMTEKKDVNWQKSFAA